LAGLEGALSSELTIGDLRRLARRDYDGPKRVLRQRGIAPGDPRNAPGEAGPPSGPEPCCTRWELNRTRPRTTRESGSGPRPSWRPCAPGLARAARHRTDQ